MPPRFRVATRAVASALVIVFFALLGWMGYVILEVGDAAPHVTFVRVDYDIERAMRAIRESALPDEFAEDLRTGGSTAPSNEYVTIETRP